MMNFLLVWNLWIVKRHECVGVVPCVTYTSYVFWNEHRDIIRDGTDLEI